MEKEKVSQQQASLISRHQRQIILLGDRRQERKREAKRKAKKENTIGMEIRNNRGEKGEVRRGEERMTGEERRG